MPEQSRIYLGATHDGNPVHLLPRMANRHGIIAGATGTGKTVTLQLLVERFSRLGVPVLTVDVKGDLAGLAQPAGANNKVAERTKLLGLHQFTPQAAPTVFWDVFGRKGHPVRTTISEIGPLLLSRFLDLNETQEGVLQIAFSLADDEGLLLLDLKDLRALLAWIGENAADVKVRYGNVSAATIGAIQRRLLVLEEAGGDLYFGEPALEIETLLKKDLTGRGLVHVLDASTLIENPRIYSAFLLWLMSELFEELEEIGDIDLPRMVCFFDEAHLLFDDAPKELLERIERVVRLVRSKGVGIYFVTQNPADIPDSVAAQLGNRIQHALRAFTPKETKALHIAANSFRPNPALDVKAALTELAVGEALVSTLDSSGTPGVVERVWIAPPESRLGPITDAEREQSIAASPFAGKYEKAVDRESAYEKLQSREAKLEQRELRSSDQTQEPAKRKGYQRQSAGEAFFKSLVRSAGNYIGRQLIRGVLGSIRGGRK